ncbi:MAG: GH1 family beta-glucosidase [Gammaproteobacteria bacterium]
MIPDALMLQQPANLLGFPGDFIWGVSSSAYQIEGAAQENGRAPGVWDTFCRMKGRINNDDNAETACDHYHRYTEDVSLMRDLGLDAYRFSISWPRVMPRGCGGCNDKGLDFYDRLIDSLLTAGIEPWVCLYHWDFPQALADKGGWINRDSVGWFADYTMLVARRYGDRVKRWATFNEQSVSTLFGFVWGLTPPAVADHAAYLQAVHHQNLAHGAAVDVLRVCVPDAALGIIHNRQRVYAEQRDAAHAFAVAPLEVHWNRMFPDPQLLGFYPAAVADAMEPYMRAGDMSRICRPLDWFGLNHYGPLWAKTDAHSVLGFHLGAAPDEAPHPEIGWAIHPDDFRKELLETYRRYRLPLYVTANGCGSDQDTPDASGRVNDAHRVAYLRDYTQAMGAALREGADVRGYFVWSLLDNFEWGSGYANRFGLVYVDFATLQRIPKASAAWYAALIRVNRKKRKIAVSAK